ncbi:MAG: AAA family ATPase [Limnobacter sp.]|nr:AAA family ATPase [Limnobacter sp.]
MNQNPQIVTITDRLQAACPEALRHLKCWVLWKAIRQQSGKVAKIPYYVNGTTRGGHGTEEDKSKLAMFDVALDVLNGGGYAGLGIATLPEFGITIGDFDDKHGQGLHPDAEALAGTTYAERSPGGKGIHAIWMGSMPSAKNNSIGVEVFGRNGFVTFTGQRVNSNEVKSLPESVKMRLSQLLKPKPNAATQIPAEETHQVETDHIDATTIRDIKSALRSLEATNYDAWIRNGQRLKALGEVGRELWFEWSETDTRFDEVEAAEKWDSFNGVQTGYPAIFKEAQALGWINPASKAPRPIAPGAVDAVESYFVPIGEMLKDKAPPDWLIHGHIEAGALALLFGPPSAGKSFLSLDWSLCVATGREWNGRKVKQGGVCYLAGEGFAGFRRRCAAWAKYNQVEIAEVPMFFNQRTVQLIDETSCFDAHNAVNYIVETNGPLSLLVLDTFNRTGGGDENSNSDVAKILHHIERFFLRPFNCTVLIVHHVGHGEGDRSRGASALPAGVDSAFALTNKEGTRTLKTTKQKEIEPGPDQSFDLLDVVLNDWPVDPDTGELQMSAVLVPTEAPTNTAKRHKLSARQVDALECLTTASENGKAVQTPYEVVEKMGLDAPRECVPEHVWRDLFYACPSFDQGAPVGTRQKAFRRAVEDLRKMGLIAGSHGYFWKF